MSQADTLKYWNAMQRLRDSQPVVTGPKGTIVSCKADLSGSDDTYGIRCPAPWLAYNVQPSSSSVQLCFPIDYFHWCKLYINEALRQRPGMAASAEARVVWTLDVWAHVSYALFALNVNWSAQDETRLQRGLAPSVEVAWLLAALGGSGDVLRWLQLAKDAAVASAVRQGGNANILEKYKTAEIQPVVGFGSLPVFPSWVGSYFARGGTKTPNPLWTLLLDTVQPWSSNWSRNWLTSKGNKDAADVAAYASDPPLAMATMQWRLLSARDFESSARSKYTLYNGLPRLSQYIAAVSRQPQAKTVSFEGSTTIVAVPTHAWAMDIVQGFAGVLLGLNYKETITRALEAHRKYSEPKLTATGALMTVAESAAKSGLPPPTKVPGDSLGEVFLTPGDWRRRWAGEVNKLQAPSIAWPDAAQCNSLSGTAKDTCKQGVIAAQAAYSAMYAVPIYGQVAAAALAVMDKLIQASGLPMAVGGGGYDPFRPLEAPVARTLTASGWSLASDGSTLDVWARWAMAAANYSSVIPGLFTSGKVANNAVKGACTTYPVNIRGEDSWCKVCKDQPLPACAAYVPEYAAQMTAKVPVLAAARDTASSDIVASCDQLAVAWALENPQYADCITAADLPMWQQICRAVSLKQLTVEAGMSMWAQYVVNVKGCGVRLPPSLAPPAPGTPLQEPGTLWSVLTDGVVHGVNPLRALSASRAFAGGVLSPFNPLRGFLGGRS